jgi:hypothetical protein
MSDWGIMPSSAEEPVQGCFSSQAQQGGPVVVGSGYRQRGRETGPPASAGDDGATGWAGTPCDGRRSLHSPHPPRLVSLSAVCACTHGLAPTQARAGEHHRMWRAEWSQCRAPMPDDRRTSPLLSARGREGRRTLHACIAATPARDVARKWVVGRSALDRGVCQADEPQACSCMLLSASCSSHEYVKFLAMEAYSTH